MQTELERYLSTAFNHATPQDDAVRHFLLARQIIIDQGTYDPSTMPAMCGVHTFPFGKYRGQLVTDVAATDLPYLRWFAKNVDSQPDLVRFIEQLLQKGMQL